MRRDINDVRLICGDEIRIDQHLVPMNMKARGRKQAKNEEKSQLRSDRLRTNKGN